MRNKIQLSIMLIGLCFSLANCQPKTKNTLKLTDIVLINYGDIDNRCDWGELIDNISKCNPKVIGVNILFDGQSDDICNRRLLEAISNSGKVVLIEGYEDSVFVESEQRVAEAAMYTGLTGLSQSENGNVDYYYRVDRNVESLYSFPFLIATQYDTTKSKLLASKSHSGDYQINFIYGLKDFLVIENSSEIIKNKELIKDKLVIVGYLGSEAINYFKTPVTNKSTDQTHGTVIIANVVLDILNTLDNDEITRNKYAEFIWTEFKARRKTR